MAEDGVRYLPALAALANDLVLGYSHISKEGLIKVGISGHIHQRTHFDTRSFHIEEQKRNALVLGCLRLTAHQAKYPVGDVCGTGPDFLAVDYPFITI